MQLTWRLSRAQSSPALGTASKRCVARPADPARPHSPLSTAHACPPRHAQTCNFDVLYACASARLEPARLPWPARELHRSPVTHALRAGTSRPPITTSRTIAQRTCAHSRRQTLSVCTHCCTCTNSCTHPRSPRRPKRNIKTAMNHGAHTQDHCPFPHTWLGSLPVAVPWLTLAPAALQRSSSMGSPKKSNSDSTRRSRCAPEPLQTFTTIARLSPMLSRSHPVHSFALAGVQVSCAASPLPTTAVQPHMQPMADRAPLCAQACRATASRPIFLCFPRKCCSTWCVLTGPPPSLTPHSPTHPLIPSAVRQALAPEEKLTYASKGPQTPMRSAEPQPTEQPSIHSATGTRRAAPPRRRASRAALRASRRARSAAAAS